MARVQVLPDVLASQVAAGEVVERPASVIKELVENSLDAGAKRIEVTIERAGMALMRVGDDGSGMTREDALLSLERHATSKLRTSEDLASIVTMGFRGEALPSIASVSRFTLATREPDALAGTEIVVEGGMVREVRDWGGAPGTVVEVRQLFYNVPARRKFLRSENTEFGHIEQTVRVQALAHPDVAFTLIRDGRVVFQLPGNAPLGDRIEALVGGDWMAALIECPQSDRGGLRVHGYLSRPGRIRADRSLALTFVNGRAVENVALTQALRLGYGDALARGQHPLCFLFIDMDPRAVDVNVHPAKREVRFRDGLGVQTALASVVQEVLRSSATAAAGSAAAPRREESANGIAPTPPDTRTTPPIFRLDPPHREAPVLAHQPTLRLPVANPAAKPLTPEPSTPVSAPARPLAPVISAAPPRPEETQPPSEATAPRFRVLGLLGTQYAVLESAEGLVLMALRGAHERVLYEEMRQRLAADDVTAQRLLVPHIWRVSPRDFALFKDHAANLRRLGFGLEEFGENTVKLDAVPAALGSEAAADPASALESLLHDLQHAGESAARGRLDLDALAAVVSARAVTRTSAVDLSSVGPLLDRLMRCDMPYCDPAGRPTLVQMSFQELARKFGLRG